MSVSPAQAGALPLDHLFRALAETYAERAALVLLSGLRSVGAAEMKAAGGLVVLQAHQSAAKAQPPEQPLLGKSADLVVPGTRLVPALVQYFHPASQGHAGGATPLEADAVGPILTVLSETLFQEASPPLPPAISVG